MYDQSKDLCFPMMAGSSVPVAPRRPDLRPDVGIEWQTALAVGYGDASYGEAFGYHALEGLQVMMERRKGGETGVKAGPPFLRRLPLSQGVIIGIGFHPGSGRRSRTRA